MVPQLVSAAITTNAGFDFFSGSRNKSKANKKKALQNSCHNATATGWDDDCIIIGVSSISPVAASQSSLFDLPAEVRMMIYRFLFVNARIVVEHTGDASGVRVQIYRQYGASTAILRTNKIVFDEAMMVLRQSTDTIHSMNHYNTNRRLIMLDIPKKWRDCIKVIDYDVATPSMYLYLPDYANLREIRIGTKMFSLGTRTISNEDTVDEVMMNLMQKRVRSLKYRGLDWIPDNSPIKITMRLLIFDSHKDVATGWEFYVDVAHWCIARRTKARFTVNPRDTSRDTDERRRYYETREWNKQLRNWNIKLLQ